MNCNVRNSFVSGLYAGFMTLCLFSSSLHANAGSRVDNQASVEIMLLGVDHLSQLYNHTPESDVYSDKKQLELAQLRRDLAVFAPQQIMLEVESGNQKQLSIDYQSYVSGKLNIQQQPNGRSEKYQLGFKLAKQLGLKDLYAANHYDYTPQSALASGDNIEYFQAALKGLQNTVRPLSTKVKNDKLSLYDYLTFMNKPELVRFTHRILFNVPAKVVNGDFTESAKQKINMDVINHQYIGAEYIGLFYQRNLKIYSNILIGQMASGAQKILVIFGQLHIGVLQELLRENPDYQLVSPIDYLDDNNAKEIDTDLSY